MGKTKRALNKRERDFYNNIPNLAKVYFRTKHGILLAAWWDLYDGDCTSLFEFLEGCEILNIACCRANLPVDFKCWSLPIKK